MVNFAPAFMKQLYPAPGPSAPPRPGSGPAGCRSRRRSCHAAPPQGSRSEEHTSELQSLAYLVCRLLLEKKKRNAQVQLDHEYVLVTSERVSRPYDTQ